jgi:hypothetical protein
MQQQGGQPKDNEAPKPGDDKKNDNAQASKEQKQPDQEQAQKPREEPGKEQRPSGQEQPNPEQARNGNSPKAGPKDREKSLDRSEAQRLLDALQAGEKNLQVWRFTRKKRERRSDVEKDW